MLGYKFETKGRTPRGSGKLCLRDKCLRPRDVEFRVRESGRQRMLKEKSRNVHAFAVGRLIDYVHADDTPLGADEARRIKD